MGGVAPGLVQDIQELLGIKVHVGTGKCLTSDRSHGAAVRFLQAPLNSTLRFRSWSLLRSCLSLEFGLAGREVGALHQHYVNCAGHAEAYEPGVVI